MYRSTWPVRVKLLKQPLHKAASTWFYPITTCALNGLEALELVRRAAPKIPFILITGALGDERAVELLRSGATDFVLKDRLALCTRNSACAVRARRAHGA